MELIEALNYLEKSHENPNEMDIGKRLEKFPKKKEEDYAIKLRN